MRRVVRSRSRKRTGVRTENGGAKRDRTADPLLAKQVLSQLSYSPMIWYYLWCRTLYYAWPVSQLSLYLACSKQAAKPP